MRRVYMTIAAALTDQGYNSATIFALCCCCIGRIQCCFLSFSFFGEKPENYLFSYLYTFNTNLSTGCRSNNFLHRIPE